jgi:hypothetical protein
MGKYGKIIYKWAIFHGYVSLPEGNLWQSKTLENSRWKSVFDCDIKTTIEAIGISRSFFSSPRQSGMANVAGELATNLK